MSSLLQRAVVHSPPLQVGGADAKFVVKVSLTGAPRASEPSLGAEGVRWKVTVIWRFQNASSGLSVRFFFRVSRWNISIKSDGAKKISREKKLAGKPRRSVPLR